MTLAYMMSEIVDKKRKIEYQLSAPPTEVMNLLSANTETYHFSTAFFLEQDYKKDFESVIDGNSFKLYRKPRARGGTNSYIPWLHGKVTPTESGSQVRVWFELDKFVRFFDKTMQGLLYLFTAVGIVWFVYRAIYGTLEIGNFVVLVVLGFSLFVRYAIKARGEVLAQQEEEAGLQFLDNLFLSVKLEINEEELTASLS
jgi:hypothetical protein